MAALKLKSGDDIQIRFTITDSAGTAIPLTGGTISLKIAKNVNISNANAEYYGEFTSFTDATNGIHVETIPDSTTKDWTQGQYKYQVRFVDSSTIVRSEDIGPCVIEENLIDDE